MTVKIIHQIKNKRMEDRRFNFHKVKKKYLKFLTSQEVMSEPFRDKLGQLNW